MENFEIIKKVVDGHLEIDVPAEFNNMEVKVTVSPKSEYGDEEQWAGLPAHKKVDLIKTFMGADKFPSVKVGKYDVYYQ